MILSRSLNVLPRVYMNPYPQSRIHHDLLTRCVSNSSLHYGAENRSTSRCSMTLKSSFLPACLRNHSLSSSEQLNKCRLDVPQTIAMPTNLSNMRKINSSNADISPFLASVVMYLPSVKLNYPTVDVEVVPDDGGKSCRSVLKQRRKKMNKHKYRKWRRKMRFKRRALGR